MSISIENLNPRQMDAIKELGNIGAGHAATALSKILLKPVDMRVPMVELVQFDHITDFLGGPEQWVTVVYFRVEGDLTGNLFFIMDRKASDCLIQDLFAIRTTDILDGRSYSEMESSAIKEVGNILAGSYLSSLADLTDLHLTPTVPALAMDMAGAILSYGLLHAGSSGDVALVIDTNFIQGDNKVEGRFFFIPDPDSLGNLLQALGVHKNYDD